jgi:hypothetical protein
MKLLRWTLIEYDWCPYKKRWQLGAGGSVIYSRGRDQEDHGLKPAQEIVHETLSRKKNVTKKERLVEWLKV